MILEAQRDNLQRKIKQLRERAQSLAKSNSRSINVSNPGLANTCLEKAKIASLDGNLLTRTALRESAESMFSECSLDIERQITEREKNASIPSGLKAEVLQLRKKKIKQLFSLFPITPYSKEMNVIVNLKLPTSGELEGITQVTCLLLTGRRHS